MKGTTYLIIQMFDLCGTAVTNVVSDNSSYIRIVMQEHFNIGHVS